MLEEAGIGITFSAKAQREEKEDKFSLFLAATFSQKEAVFYFTSFIRYPPLVTDGENIHCGELWLGPPQSTFVMQKKQNNLENLFPHKA